jgi:PPM family protein phosphatase
MDDPRLYAVGIAVVVLLAYFWRRRTDDTPVPKAASKDPAPKAETKPETKPEAKAEAPKPEVKAEAKAAAKVETKAEAVPVIPKLAYEDDDEVDPTRVGAVAAVPRAKIQPPTKKIVWDDEAAEDEAEHPEPMLLVTAMAQTDRGLRRKRNEDSLLSMADRGVFVVCDGMGGYEGGQIASSLSAKTIENAFLTSTFDAEPHSSLPAPASELARAIQMANTAVHEYAQRDRALEGMGTTICAARFTPNNQRLYIGHVGDSRIYRMRGRHLEQMTADHTMKDLGVTGAASAHLSRAIGVWPTVDIDILLAKPSPGDVYILCSDGLTKMVDDSEIEEILVAHESDPAEAVDALIGAANAHGGKDNVTVIVISVLKPT